MASASGFPAPFVGSRVQCRAFLAKTLAGTWRDEVPVCGRVQVYSVTVTADVPDEANVLTERCDGSMKRGLGLVRVVRVLGNIFAIMWGQKFYVTAMSSRGGLCWEPLQENQHRVWPWVRSNGAAAGGSVTALSSPRAAAAVTTFPKLPRYGSRVLVLASEVLRAGTFLGWSRKGASARIRCDDEETESHVDSRCIVDVL